MSDTKRAEELARKIHVECVTGDPFATLDEDKAAALLSAEMRKVKEAREERMVVNAINWWLHDPDIKGKGAIARMKAAILRDEEE
jgi:hypothetical protein